MERGFHLRIPWNTKIVEAYFLTFAAFVIVFDYLPLGFTGSSSTVASAFLSFLKASYLPPKWTLADLTKTGQFEVNTITALFLAFVVCFPIIAYAVARGISPPNLHKSTFAALVVGAAVVFYQGAAWGLTLDHYYLISLVPFFLGAFFPVLSGYSFYLTMLQGILAWALIFIAPVYVILFIEFRRSHRLRWHL